MMRTSCVALRNHLEISLLMTGCKYFPLFSDSDDVLFIEFNSGMYQGKLETAKDDFSSSSLIAALGLPFMSLSLSGVFVNYDVVY